MLRIGVAHRAAVGDAQDAGVRFPATERALGGIWT
jgi:hypothetical protein